MHVQYRSVQYSTGTAERVQCQWPSTEQQADNQLQGARAGRLPRDEDPHRPCHCGRAAHHPTSRFRGSTRPCYTAPDPVVGLAAGGGAPSPPNPPHSTWKQPATRTYAAPCRCGSAGAHVPVRGYGGHAAPLPPPTLLARWPRRSRRPAAQPAPPFPFSVTARVVDRGHRRRRRRARCRRRVRLPPLPAPPITPLLQ